MKIIDIDIDIFIYNNCHILYNDNYYKGGEKKIMKKLDIPMLVFAFIGLFFWWINIIIFFIFQIIYDTYFYIRLDDD